MSDISIIPRSMGGLTFDAVFEEDHTLELEVTDNPVEVGVSITDHAYMNPYKLRLMAGVTNTPLTPKDDGFGTGDQRTREAFKKLEALMRTREPFDVQTGLRLYKNMICLSVNTSQAAESANALVFTAELREIIIVYTQAVEYPPRAKGKADNQAGKKKSSGEKQSKEVDSKKTQAPQERSLAKKLWSALGRGPR